ncbi:MAG: hypothetical protein PWQ79_324 [Thermococcaceae archaeon]|uniref:sugar phosphate isomerase/epimerase family protein n=1 Tax=Oceanotoga sp. TaxID=2108366 RepID=UPI0024AA7C8C|nr:TIM barrel protein [Oceanotoga sp.]MDI3474305.1 hypothetical protein [Thermococcaceae archaeon]MDK2913409.1 hypothetical protein [Thermococcaceae archaeon]MDN5343256.1 hypothetical protein [Oceanotoga sp.]
MKVGLSTTAFNGSTPREFEKWLDTVSELGFEFVELVSEWPHQITPENVREWIEVLETFSMANTLHAPFIDLNIGSFNDKIRRVSLEILEEAFEVAATLGSEVLTVPPGYCSPLSRKHRGVSQNS